MPSGRRATLALLATACIAAPVVGCGGGDRSEGPSTSTAEVESLRDLVAQYEGYEAESEAAREFCNANDEVNFSIDAFRKCVDEESDGAQEGQSQALREGVQSLLPDVGPRCRTALRGVITARDVVFQEEALRTSVTRCAREAG